VLLLDPDIETVEIDDDESSADEGRGVTVYFHEPGLNRDATDLGCLASASDLIMRMSRPGKCDCSGRSARDTKI
jgi:hypothetical protein